MAGGFFQAADDIVRLAANGITFGGADRLASAMGETDAAAKTAAAADRAGFAGDIAKMIGIGGGIKTGLAIGVPAIKALPKIAKAALSKKGAATAAVGTGALVSYNQRNQAPQARAAAAPTAKAQVKPQAAAKPAAAPKKAPKAADDDLAGMRPPSFAEMAQDLAAAQGGAVSARQLAALSEIAARTAVKPGKLPSAKDMAGREYLKMVDQTYTQQQADAQKLMETDPARGLVAGQAAAKERMEALKVMLGSNPWDEALVDRLPQIEDQ